MRMKESRMKIKRKRKSNKQRYSHNPLQNNNNSSNCLKRLKRREAESQSLTICNSKSSKRNYRRNRWRRENKRCRRLKTKRKLNFVKMNSNSTLFGLNYRSIQKNSRTTSRKKEGFSNKNSQSYKENRRRKNHFHLITLTSKEVTSSVRKKSSIITLT